MTIYIQKTDITIENSKVFVKSPKVVEKLNKFPDATTNELAEFLGVPAVKRSDLTVDSDGLLIFNGPEYVKAIENRIATESGNESNIIGFANNGICGVSC
jgi:hypothetical protein